MNELTFMQIASVYPSVFDKFVPTGNSSNNKAIKLMMIMIIMNKRTTIRWGLM